MKRIFLLISILAVLLGSTGCTKECKEWYSSVNFKSVSKTPNNNNNYNGWYEIDYLVNELNFYARYINSADGYEECKTKERIHEPLKADIKIYCSGTMIIGNDTLPPNTNLFGYFNFYEKFEGPDVFEYNKATHPFPKFKSVLNNFKIEIPMSDGQVLVGTQVVSVN